MCANFDLLGQKVRSLGQLGGGRLRPAQLHRLGQQLTEPAGAVVERQARVDRSAQHRAPLEVGDWRLVQRGHRVGHLAGGDVDPRLHSLLFVFV